MRATALLSTGVGWVSLGLGAAMTLDPPEAQASWVGRTARASRASWAPWMLARALLNAVICLVYARVLAEGDFRGKEAKAGVALMAALTLFDYALSRRLRRAETP